MRNRAAVQAARRHRRLHRLTPPNRRSWAAAFVVNGTPPTFFCGWSANDHKWGDVSGGELSGALLREFASVVGDAHVLTGDATAGYAVDWTGRFRGHAPAVLRPADTGEVAAVLALCRDAGVPVVPQGGNTGLVGGGVPRARRAGAEPGPAGPDGAGGR